MESADRGNRWRRRFDAVDPAWLRLAVALAVVLAVAAGYPWYAYRVDGHLRARESAAALVRVEHSVPAPRRASTVAVEPTGAVGMPRPPVPAEVVGASDQGASLVVIVRMHADSLAGARDAICRQAPGWLRMPVEGRVLRVQRHRGDRPALSIGEVRC